MELTIFRLLFFAVNSIPQSFPYRANAHSHKALYANGRVTVKIVAPCSRR